MAGILNIASGLQDWRDEDYKRRRNQQADDLKSQEFGETVRSNKANEDLRNRTLLDMSELRRIQAKDKEDAQAEAQKNHQDTLAVRTLSLRPVGAPVTEEEMGREIGAGAPSSLYKVGEYKYGTMDPAQGEGPIRQRDISFGGTQAQMDAQARIKDAEINAANANADRDAMRADTAAHRAFMASLAREHEDRMREQGGPVVITQDADGNIHYVGRGDAVRNDSRPADPPAIRQQGNSLRNDLTMAKEILNEGNATGWAGIGPVAGGVGGTIADYLGPDSKIANFIGAGGDKGSALRAKMRDLFASEAFGQGGKNLTGTEKQLVSQFRATAEKNPKQAAVYLDNAIQSIERRLGSIKQGDETVQPNAGGGGTKKTRTIQVGKHTVEVEE